MEFCKYMTNPMKRKEREEGSGKMMRSLVSVSEEVALHSNIS